MKKFLIMMMCVIMVVCFMPTVAMADSEPVDVSTLDELKTELEKAAAAGSGDTTINIKADITLTENQSWSSLHINGYQGAGTVTIKGNGHKIVGLDAPLFSGGFAGASGLVIDNLTIDNANIKDATNDQGIGAFISNVDSMPKISLTNCHLVNSTIESTGGARVGGLIGWTSGYNKPNDGPVDTYINITNCSVENTSIKAAGSVGAIIGHAGCNPATYHTIKNCTVTDCTLNSTDDGGWRVGVVVGTANVGQVTIETITESGNTLTQAGKTAPEHSNLYGRFVPQNGYGVLVIDGNVIEGNDNFVPVAMVDGVYETLAGAINKAQTGSTVALLKDVELTQKLTIDKAITIDGNGHTISAADGFTKDSQGHLMLLQSNVTMKNVTLDSKNRANGINTYGADKSLHIIFENVKMLNSAGNGLTAKGGTITLKNVAISGSAWKQSVDISASDGLVNGANLVVDRYCSFGDQGAVVFDNPEDGHKVGTVTSSDPSRLIVSSSDETRDWANNNSTYTKRVFTFTRISTDNGITLPPTTPTDNVTNSGSNAADNATTSADLSGSTSTSNGTTSATVDKTTADKIVDKAVENKSTEVVIDATANTTTAADSTTIAQVTIPTETLGAIAEKTEADVTIKTDVAEVKLDNASAAAVAEQAQGDTVQIIAEKVAEETDKVEFELKVVCSDGKVISDFKGGNVAVTVALPKAIADKKVVCVYIDDNGHMSKVAGQKNADGTYTFNTGHFSSYAIMAEEEADAAIAAQKEAIKNIKIKLTSKQVKTKAGKKAVKITWTADAGDKVLDGVEVFRSTERYKGYGTEPFYTSTKGGNTGSYTNTKSLKKGTKYYYRVRGYVLVDGQKVYTDYSTKAWRTVK